MTTDFNITDILAKIDQAVAEKQLTQSAAAHIRQWLTEPRYAEYAPQVAQHIAAGKWKELDDAFWTIIPFGTGGRRGRMYPIGSNGASQAILDGEAITQEIYEHEALAETR